ncbi:MAG: glycosyltransferase family 2 protein, partial [Streptomycetales bacterium]
ALWEGAVVARRSALERTGGWPEGFFYAHEGIDLAWRMIAAGYRVEYRGDLLAHHPAVVPTRHGYFHYLSARNRVWLARRNLPLPLAVGYVGVWSLLTAARLRGARDAREALRGFRAGLTSPCGIRRPMSWAAVWRLTRAGRPPLI